AQAGVCRHGRGKGGRHDPGQARPRRENRRYRRAVADRAVHLGATVAAGVGAGSGGGMSDSNGPGAPDARRWEGRFPPRSRPRRVEGGLKPRSTRGAVGRSWWAKRCLAVLESFALGSRLTRGRSYARAGQVLSLRVAPGEVTATVQGSRRAPYQVRVGLEPFSDQVWEAVEVALAEQALYSAKLLAGEL